MTRVIPTSAAIQQAASLSPPSSGPSPLVLVLLAAFGYGGYRLYKHFKKG